MKLENIIGVGLLVLAIFGFIASMLLGLPTNAEVEKAANPIGNLADNFFTSENELNATLEQLKVPAGIPVTVGQDSVGRSNVFESF